MADASEVSTALVNLISAAIYPTGINNASAVGFGVKVYAGWPDPVGLETDLKANIAHITIWPMPHEKVTFFEKRDNGWKLVSSNSATGTLQREARRQKRDFKITVWANCHDTRDQLSQFFDSFMSGVYHLGFSDLTSANINYVGSNQIDSEQKRGVYRRDFTYAIDYPTMQTMTGFKILQVNPTIDQGFNNEINS